MKTWTDLPCVIRKYIIKMNTSLKEDHYLMFKDTIIAIRLRKRDRVCVGCMRNAIFNNKPLYRRPSLKLYIRHDNDDQVRVTCECDKHRYNFDQIFIKGGIEMRTIDLLSMLRSRLNVTNFLKYNGMDDTELDILTKVLNGCETITMSEPLSKRWVRYTYVSEEE